MSNILTCCLKRLKTQHLTSKAALVLLLPLAVAACASPMQVQARNEAGISICYSRLNSSLEAVTAAAENHCAKYGRQASEPVAELCGSETFELHRTLRFSCVAPQ